MIKDGLKKKRDLTDLPKKRFDNHVDSGFLAEMLAGICGLTQLQIVAAAALSLAAPQPCLLPPRSSLSRCCINCSFFV